MTVRDVMTNPVIRIRPEEPVGVAARMLEHYNIGALPVCGGDGRICGVVTDRDLVTRCLASGKTPASTLVQDVMTGNVVFAEPNMDTVTAAGIMGKAQVRRLPVLENGRLCGMVSLGDLAVQEESCFEAGDALTEISSTVSRRE